LAERSLELQRRLANTLGEAVALGSLGEVEWRNGNADAAMELGQQSVELAEAAGFDWWRGGQLYRLTEYSLARDRLDEAERFGRAALEVVHRAGDRQHRVYVLALLARIAAETRRRE